MTKPRFLSLNAMEKVLRDIGASRISEGARGALAEVVEQRALTIAKVAKKYAQHAGRKTVTERDIEMAAEDN